MEAHQLINQDSGDFEYYTPISIVYAARLVMGGIDMDPATSLTANSRVKATQIWTEQDDGLLREWAGKVWLNHPFSRKGNALWVNKLIEEYGSGRVEQSCNITFAATSEKWFQPLASFPQCYLSPRTNYHLPNGTLKRGVTKGSVVTYMGPHRWRFAEIFGQFGVVKVQHGWDA
jgi:hypothetical protein